MNATNITFPTRDVKTTIALPAAAAFGTGRAQGPGRALRSAPVPGGWTALELARRGARELIDMGPGHARQFRRRTRVIARPTAPADHTNARRALDPGGRTTAASAAASSGRLARSGCSAGR
jgi:hypothetical protein